MSLADEIWSLLFHSFLAFIKEVKTDCEVVGEGERRLSATSRLLRQTQTSFAGWFKGYRRAALV
jgi:hypothetical protein